MDRDNTADKATNADSQTVAQPAPAAPSVPAAPAAPAPAAPAAPAAETAPVPGALDMNSAAIPVATATDTPAPDNGDAGDPPPNEPTDTPEPPEYEFTVPDGFEPHEEALNDFKAMAAEMKLPQDQAQKLMDKYHELRRDESQKQQQHIQAEMTRIWQEQQKEIKDDPQFGGTNYPATQEAVAFALHKFGSPRGEDGEFPLAKALKDSGMANCPELFRFFARVGQYCREATPAVSDSRGVTAPKPLAEALFPGYNP